MMLHCLLLHALRPGALGGRVDASSSDCSSCSGDAVVDQQPQMNHDLKIPGADNSQVQLEQRCQSQGQILNLSFIKNFGKGCMSFA